MFRIQIVKLLIRFFIIMPLVFGLAACPVVERLPDEELDILDTDGDGLTDEELDILDTDGDGLTDSEEINEFGTSHVLADTDGDGVDDWQEIFELGFNPDVNNFAFNPLIADVPKFSIELTSVPNIQLFFETSISGTTTIGTVRSDSVATSRTNSTTQTNSTAIEQSHTVGGTTEVETSIFGPKTSTSVSYEYTHSTTRETSTGWTQEQSIENQTTLSEALEKSQTESISSNLGGLSYSVKVTNNGYMSFTLENLTLDAVMADPYNPGEFATIGTLTLDNVDSFPPTRINLDQSFPLTFSNKKLDVTTIKKLLKDSSGLVTKVGLYQVVNDEGTSYTFDGTAIGAKTATVIVDYGTELEQYQVATNIDPDNLGITVGSIMRDVLRIPYGLGASAALSQVRDKGTDPGINSSWMVVHLSDDGINQTGTVYDDTQDYDFDGLIIYARQVLHLVYLEDADGDGLGIREEIFYGTDAYQADTDGDGLSDFDEVKTGWLNGFDNTQIFSSPIIADMDDDGLNDLEEMQLGSDPRNTDTDGDLTLDGEEANLVGRNIWAFDPKFDFTLDYLTFTYSCDYFNVDFWTEAVYWVTIRANLTSNDGGSLKHSAANLTPQSVAVGRPLSVDTLFLSANFIDPLGTFTLSGSIADVDSSILDTDDLLFDYVEFNISDYEIGSSTIVAHGVLDSTSTAYEAPCAGYIVLTVDRE